jgi:hypothetical protein
LHGDCNHSPGNHDRLRHSISFPEEGNRQVYCFSILLVLLFCFAFCVCCCLIPGLLLFQKNHVFSLLFRTTTGPIIPGVFSRSSETYFPGHPGFNLPQTFPKDFPCTYTGAQVESAFMRWKAFANKNEITERKRPPVLVSIYPPGHKTAFISLASLEYGHE